MGPGQDPFNQLEKMVSPANGYITQAKKRINKTACLKTIMALLSVFPMYGFASFSPLTFRMFQGTSMVAKLNRCQRETMKTLPYRAPEL